MNWVVYAILSAFFASLVAIFAKIGVTGVSSNLMVAIRTVIIVIFAWAIVFIQGTAGEVFKIPRHTYLFIVLSAIATGLSWLFYFKAIQIGPVSRVAPIDKMSIVLTVTLAFLFLGEKPTLGNIVGGALITLGVLVAVLVK
jgi:transporter family protein